MLKSLFGSIISFRKLEWLSSPIMQYKDYGVARTALSFWQAETATRKGGYPFQPLLLIQTTFCPSMALFSEFLEET
jgi:hypothetical protein